MEPRDNGEEFAEEIALEEMKLKERRKCDGRGRESQNGLGLIRTLSVFRSVGRVRGPAAGGADPAGSPGSRGPVVVAHGTVGPVHPVLLARLFHLHLLFRVIARPNVAYWGAKGRRREAEGTR